MTISASAVELAAGYEALRAQAMGEMPAASPRGLTVLMGGGMPAWMCALAPASRSTTPVRPGAAHEPSGFGAELVSLLAEMVLSSRKRCLT